jgi:hypothetical protein
LERLLNDVENLPLSRKIRTRTTGLVCAAILLAGVTAWLFLYGVVSDFDTAPRVADVGLALPQEHERSQQHARLVADDVQQTSTGASLVVTADALALQQERLKTETLTRDLAAARQENESQAAALKKANDKPDNNQQLAETQQALQQERSKTETLTRDLAAARQENESQAAALKKDNDKPDDNPSAARRDPAQARVRETQAVAGAPNALVAFQPEARKPPDPTPTTTDLEMRRLMARAQQLIEQRNILAARSVLEHAAGFGQPAALFALAKTYDPNQLAAWGTVGTQGDPALARQLYQKALAGGMPEARLRLDALQP